VADPGFLEGMRKVTPVPYLPSSLLPLSVLFSLRNIRRNEGCDAKPEGPQFEARRAENRGRRPRAGWVCWEETTPPSPPVKGSRGAL